MEAEGARFHAMRPSLTPDDREAMKVIMDARKGPEYLLKKMIFPQVRASYEDLLEAVRGADLLVTHPITYAGPIVAEQTGIAWVSTVLAPASLFSAYDPPVLAPAPCAGEAARAGAGLSSRIARSWPAKCAGLERACGAIARRARPAPRRRTDLRRTAFARPRSGSVLGSAGHAAARLASEYESHRIPLL